MGDDVPMMSEQPNVTPEGPVASGGAHFVAATTSATAIFANNPQNQYILLRKQPMTSADPQMAQTTLTRLPVQCAPSSSQPQIRAQNVSIMQPPMFQKMAVNRPILTLNRQGLIPVQVSQGHTIILNSIAQGSSLKHPILPKGASPEKITAQSNLKQVYVPLSSTLTVRSIAPRSGTSIAAGNENDKKKPQHQFVPKMIAPQPSRQIIIPAQVGQGGTVSFSHPNSLNSSSVQGLSNNVVRLQGPSGQIMQAVITPVQISSVTPGTMLVGSNSKINRNGDDPMNGEEIRVETKPIKKPCNCTKSQCLKLYCDCFANGEFCSNCNCQNCSNNIEHEIERSKAIKACLERNPSAFHPKIGKTRGIAERRHTKGCHCRRSGCLKNYCECYEAKIMCSSLCKCTGCKNFEESPERKTLMHLADAAEVRVLQQNAARSKLESQLEAATTKPLSETIEKRLPFTFITSSVTSATCECLMARAEESEIKNLSEQKAERLIIDEFERSLLQIIQMANKSKDYHV